MRALTSLYIEAMCTPDGKPFCKVTAGDQVGQLTPAEVRIMALGWIATAEAAEQDAMVLAALTDPTGAAIPLEIAGAVVADIRQRRAESRYVSRSGPLKSRSVAIEWSGPADRWSG